MYIYIATCTVYSICVCVSDCHHSEFILPVIYSLYNYNAQHRALTATVHALRRAAVCMACELGHGLK